MKVECAVVGNWQSCLAKSVAAVAPRTRSSYAEYRVAISKMLIEEFEGYAYTPLASTLYICVAHKSPRRGLVQEESIYSYRELGHLHLLLSHSRYYRR